MMLPSHLFQRVPEHAQEVTIRANDGPIESELDNRLGPIDRAELALIIRILLLLPRNVDSYFDNFVRATFCCEDRDIAGLQPKGLASLAYPTVDPRKELATVQASPEVAIFLRSPVVRIDKYSMMLALDLAEGIASHLEKVLIRRKHYPVQ
nr:hypothetical protein [Acidipila sp. EB88]